MPGPRCADWVACLEKVATAMAASSSSAAAAAAPAAAAPAGGIGHALDLPQAARELRLVFPDLKVGHLLALLQEFEDCRDPVGAIGGLSVGVMVTLFLLPSLYLIFSGGGKASEHG